MYALHENYEVSVYFLFYLCINRKSGEGALPMSRSSPWLIRHLPKAIVLLFVALLFACGSSATAAPEAITGTSPTSPTAMPAATSVPSTGGGPAPTAVPSSSGGSSALSTAMPQATQEPAGRAAPAGTLNYGTRETGIFQGHPSEASSPRIQFLSLSIGEGLIRVADDLGGAPQLAEAWEISDDFLTWTWHIQPGVEFHKGYGR
jgi:ABC-type transport system substrate-binding protein